MPVTQTSRRPQHFVTDIHGEDKAFKHLMRTRSGEVRRLLALATGLDENDEAVLDALKHIAYPEQLRSACTAAAIPVCPAGTGADSRTAVQALYTLACAVAALDRVSTSNSVQSLAQSPDSGELAAACASLVELAAPGALGSAIPETFMARAQTLLQEALDQVGAAASVLAAWARQLSAGPIHMMGDIWDRGARGDNVMDTLMSLPECSIQWGNHDICWMGAAAGDPACITTLLRNNLKYGNTQQFEEGYGISLEPLRSFAAVTYRNEGEGMLSPVMKAISVLLFKSEGQAIRRHPEWHMENRLLLDKINSATQTVDLHGREYPISTADFPTVNFKPGEDAFAFNSEEAALIATLTSSFLGSERLQRQIDWIYSKGSVYKIVDGRYLIVHGCVPMTEEGQLRPVECPGGVMRQGRELLDWTDGLCRRAWTQRQQMDLDWMGYLWTGQHSTFMGRIVTTFERTYIADKSTWEEPQDPYYSVTAESPEACGSVLREFGLDPEHAVILNGHTPVKLPKGQQPVRGGGRRYVLDGGFCRAYRTTTGIAGYTMIDDADGVRLLTHTDFAGLEAFLERGSGIEHSTQWLQRA